MAEFSVILALDDKVEFAAWLCDRYAARFVVDDERLSTYTEHKDSLPRRAEPGSNSVRRPSYDVEAERQSWPVDQCSRGGANSKRVRFACQQ